MQTWRAADRLWRKGAAAPPGAAARRPPRLAHLRDAVQPLHKAHHAVVLCQQEDVGAQHVAAAHRRGEVLPQAPVEREAHVVVHWSLLRRARPPRWLRLVPALLAPPRRCALLT